MSTKLDQSLDTIMGESKVTGARRTRTKAGRRRAAPAAKATTVAPTGGIQKNTKTPKGAPTAPAVQAPKSGDSKIIVSNLPLDVSETLVKDFFSKAIGHVKKVSLAYGPNGKSRGEATVIFSKGDSAAKAHKEYNNVGVDGRPMKIELVGGTAVPQEAVKALSERIAKPKNAAKESQKSATAKKDAPKAATNGAATAKKGKKKSGRAGRPKPKTADELDAEMADYFGNETTNGAAPAANGAAPTNGAAQPAAAAPDGEDVVM